MARFNTTGQRAKPPVALTTSPIATVTATPNTRTFEGAAGWTRTAQAELFLRAAGAVHGGTFYESTEKRDERLRELTRQIAREDPKWGLEFARWLRAEGNMRTNSLAFAVEFVHERLAFLKEQGPGYTDPHAGINRTIIRVVCRRADEPGEILAIWTSWFGKQVPKPVKRGISDAIQVLYSERSMLKYDTASKGYRFGDVLNVVHARPRPLVTEDEEDGPKGNPKTLRYNPDTRQGALFQYALDRRHHPDTAVIPESLALLGKHHSLASMPVKARRSVVTAADGAQQLAEAGFTWEALAGWLQGPMDKAAWEAVIPSMGIMAQLRNLRNFDQAGVSDKVAQQIISKLTDPQEIAKSKQFPFRFLSAYRATNEAGSLRWAYPLEQALNHSLSNVPSLGGRTLVLVDRSPSMFPQWYTANDNDRKLGVSRADQAAIFGCALALRAEAPTLIEFGGNSREIDLPKGANVLKAIEKFGQDGGTDIPSAIKRHYSNHDRVVVVTDEQTRTGYFPSNMESYGGMTSTPIDALVPLNVPVFMWNLAGYTASAMQSGSNARFTLGGLSDQAFKLIPLLEAGSTGVWPWQTSQGGE